MIKDLITPKDIKLIEQKAARGSITADETNLLMSGKWSEFQIQSAAYNLFKAQGFGDQVIFVQIDNGGSAIEGIRKKKAATGTQSGFPDTIIYVWSKSCWHRAANNDVIHGSSKKKTLWIEFKRIGGKIAENQQKWHDFLKSKGESAYFCNNLLFFERVILKEIREFLGMV